jgi:predicted transcriptional regulator
MQYRGRYPDHDRDKCLKESIGSSHLTDAVGEEQFVKVRDAMTGDVLTMTPGRSLRDAAKFMADHNVGAVVIMDPEQPGPGIFTERDLVRSIGRGDDPDAEHVSEHLTVHAAFADIEWDLEEAADTMAKGGFRHLVVVESGALCGIISMRDIMRVWRPSARPVATT